MRILYDFGIIGPGAGGITTVCRWFVGYLVNSRPEHSCFAVFPEGPGDRPMPLSEPISNLDIFDGVVDRLGQCATNEAPEGWIGGIYHRARWLSPARSGWRFLAREAKSWRKSREMERSDREAAALRRCYDDLSVDVIHCPFQWIRPVPPRHHPGIPYVMNMHDLQHEYFPHFFAERELTFRRTVWYESARVSRFVVTAAEHVRQDVIKYAGIPRERVEVIPWGIPYEGEPAPTSAEQENVRNKYSLADDFIIYPAVMWEHKNHLGLLKAMLLLKSRCVNVKLVLTGAIGPFGEKVLRFIQDNGLSDPVKHIGFVSVGELKSLYKLATGVVVPSLHEQSSGPVMEAMALGCPVAASRIADLPELLAQDCGLLFDPNDVEDIARCVDVMWTRREVCREMAERAGRRLRAIRSWKSWANKYEELYEVCAEEGRMSRK